MNKQKEIPIGASFLRVDVYGMPMDPGPHIRLPPPNNGRNHSDKVWYNSPTLGVVWRDIQSCEPFLEPED